MPVMARICSCRCFQGERPLITLRLHQAHVIIVCIRTVILTGLAIAVTREGMVQMCHNRSRSSQQAHRFRFASFASTQQHQVHHQNVRGGLQAGFDAFKACIGKSKTALTIVPCCQHVSSGFPAFWATHDACTCHTYLPSHHDGTGWTLAICAKTFAPS